jgi:hypothetical protein
MAHVSCATANFCVGTSYGSVLTFDGKAWSAPTQLVSGGHLLLGVSCPTTTFCMAVDGPRGEVFSFDGSTWSAPRRIDPAAGQGVGAEAQYGGLTSVSCTSPTFCMAADSFGRGYVYQP